MSKVKTTNIGGTKEYAKVSDRLKLFWEENPNGKIDTEREELTGGKVRFIARIWRDSAVLVSAVQSGASPEALKYTASATASADAVKKGDKENEKLETVAVGRALAMLGYLASGEVASMEEMEAFEKFRETKKLKEIEKAIDQLQKSPDLDKLKDVFTKLDLNVRRNPHVVRTKDLMKQKLTRLDENTNRVKEAGSVNTPVLAVSPSSSDKEELK